MAIRRKTKRRLLVLLIVVVAVVGAAGGIYSFRMRQIRDEIARKRTEGMAAFEKGDYFSAIHALGTYINRSKEPDVEALYKYSQARQKVEEPSAKHLLQAAGTLRHLLGLKPDHIEARRDLLDIYGRLGYSTEVIETADRILKNHPDDPQALRAKAIALARLRKLDEALELSERYNKLKPLEMDGHTLTFSILRSLERPPEDKDLIGRAKDLYEAHPGDPRTEWLMAYAYGLAGDREKEAEWCRAAAGHDDLEPDLVIRTVGLLDHLGESQEAFELLKRAGDAHNDPQIQRRLAKRLWENQDFGQLITRFSRGEAPAAEADSEVLGLLAMSLIRAGRQKEAAPFVDALGSRKGDNMAAAWAHVLNGVFLDANQDPFRLIKVWQEALERVPRYPYFNYFLANTYAAIGETDKALSFYSLAARSAPAWPFPLIEAARQLLAAGRSREALQLARAVATQRAPRNVHAAITLAEAWYANLRDGQDENASKLLELVNKILTAIPNEPRMLPIQVDLLARTGEVTKAQGVVKSVAESEKAPSERLLLRLAEVSHARKLGLEDECLLRCEKAHGMTPSVAFALAQQQSRAGQAEAGLKILQDARKKDASSNSKQWKIRLAQYLESINDNRARNAWVRLAEAFPADPQIQRLVLKARSVWPERDFVDKTINRLKEALGDDSTSWRLPRARWLLRYDTSERGVKEAAELLADVIRPGSGRVAPRLLLAECEQRLGNLSGAVEHLTAAAQRRPDLIDIQLKLAGLQQRQGDTKAARSTIEQALRSGTDDPNHVRPAAALFAAQGDTEEAIAAIRRLYPESEAAPADLLLASLYSRRNDPEKRDLENARAICEKLMEKPDLAAVQFVAGFYASRGEQKEAEATLARLAELDLKPGVRELVLGGYYARHGNVDANAADPNADAALAHYQKAIEQAPDNPVAHRLVIAAHIQHGKPDQAVKAIQKAGRLCPNDPAIQFAQQHQALLGLTEKGIVLRPLASALVQAKSQRTAAADFLRVIQEAKEKGQRTAEVIYRLRQLADRHPRFWAGQALLVGVYRRIGRPNEAGELALRAMQAFPVAPEPAWLAAESLAAAGRWAEALSVANEWRRRSASQPVGADLIAAEAEIQLGQPGPAVARLEPYLGEAMKDPEANVRVIVGCTRAMILTGQIDGAEELWEPLLKKSPAWRQGWMRLGILALPDAPSAANWLKRVAPLVPQAALDEKVALAQAWRMVDERFKQTDYTKQARVILRDVTTRPDPPAAAFQLLALLDEDANNHAAAEDGYRKALERDPNMSLSANNLSMILLRRNGDLDEALELAGRAVKLVPGMATYHDTLAQVQAKRGDYDAAIQSIARAIKFQPRNLEWPVRLVHLFIKASRIKDAREVLTQIDQAVRDPTRLPEQLKESLAEARQAVKAGPEKGARLP